MQIHISNNLIKRALFLPHNMVDEVLPGAKQVLALPLKYIFFNRQFLRIVIILP